jgi:hypothetical protein
VPSSSKGGALLYDDIGRWSKGVRLDLDDGEDALECGGESSRCFELEAIGVESRCIS